MFLVDYATRKVVWQDDDASWVPPTLRVFVDWALNRKGVPAELRRQTQAAVDRFSGDFTFGVLGGAQPSLGKAFVENLMAQGVDFNDPAALDAAVEEYNRGLDRP